MVTDPRGGGRRHRDRDVVSPPSHHQLQSGIHHEREDDAAPRLGQRNQFDRASQLRRSKKRKKSRENSILESSRNSDREKSPPKSSAKDIVIEETVKTLKTSLGPKNQIENDDSR